MTDLRLPSVAVRAAGNGERFSAEPTSARSGRTTGAQRFYLGWAQVWRRNYREANLRQRLITDPHSPSEQRSAVVRNLDPWYPAFNVQPGQKLYLAPGQRVRIW